MRSFWKERDPRISELSGESASRKRVDATLRNIVLAEGVPEDEIDGDMADESTEMLRIVLGTEMGATALPADVVEALIPFLKESLMVKGPDDLKRMGVDAFVAAVASLPSFEDGALPEPPCA